jgi:hypothetical protein
MLHISDIHTSCEVEILPLHELGQTAEAVWLCRKQPFGSRVADLWT